MKIVEENNTSYTDQQGDPFEPLVLWLLHYFGVSISKAVLRGQVAREPGKWTLEQSIEALESFSIRTPTPWAALL